MTQRLANETKLSAERSKLLAEHCKALADLSQKAAAAVEKIKRSDELEEAIRLLNDLADLQNGPPLEQHRKEWEDTMDEIYAFLNRNGR